MSASSPSMVNWSLSGTINEAILSGGTQQETVNKNLRFGGLTFTKTLKGVFTPANNTLNLLNFSILGDYPRFLLLMADKTTNFSISLANAGGMNYLPVNPFALLCLDDMSTLDNHPTILALDGRSLGAGYLSMAQGVPVNYFVAWSDGQIS